MMALFILFIVTCTYMGVPRNWSHERWTGPQGQKLKPKAESRGVLLGEKLVAGRSLRSKPFYGAWKPPTNAHIEYKFYYRSFTVQIYNALHMQGKKSNFWHLRGHGPPKSTYGVPNRSKVWCARELLQWGLGKWGADLHCWIAVSYKMSNWHLIKKCNSVELKCLVPSVHSWQ